MHVYQLRIEKSLKICNQIKMFRAVAGFNGLVAALHRVPVDKCHGQAEKDESSHYKPPENLISDIKTFDIFQHGMPPKVKKRCPGDKKTGRRIKRKKQYKPSRDGDSRDGC